ncbi:MAG: NAD(P)-binding domain-containing protein [Halobacteriovoraceae bacterium]|nr:NAD(P)-binding domain-containing protein [Halobacteriovoraceae bacterium]MCB9093762.1 NAD(P)-binding domain-containing protein [Halobacteriovoraceae bacterium]
MKKIALLGCGNLVSAIILGFHSQNKNSSYQFYCYTPSGTKAKRLAEEVGGIFVSEISELQEMDVYVFGFKPQNYRNAVIQYKDVISPGATVWSLLAGIPMQSLERDFPENGIIRIMPNTPSLKNLGVSLFIKNAKVSRENQNDFEKIMGSVSSLYPMKNDEQLDQIMGVSASGPALVFEFIKVLASIIENAGFDGVESEKIVVEMFKGSMSLVENKTSIQELQNSVTSRGGVTFEALKSLESQNFQSVMEAAIQAAYQRAISMREELS